MNFKNIIMTVQQAIRQILTLQTIICIETNYINPEGLK